jgi:hypothetical protein
MGFPCELVALEHHPISARIQEFNNKNREHLKKKKSRNSNIIKMHKTLVPSEYLPSE